MLGILSETCSWEKKAQAGKYPGQSFEKPVTLPCAKCVESKLTQTDIGLVKVEQKYYIVHTPCISTGDRVDGCIVTVNPMKDIMGTIQGYKVVCA